MAEIINEEQDCSYCQSGAEPYYSTGRWRHEGGVLCQTPERNPFPMLLFCPNCHKQHIDAPEEEVTELFRLRKDFRESGLGDRAQSISSEKLKRLMELEVIEKDLWTNPPHKSHLCHYCKTVWRPADVPTTGVENISTKGEHDTWRIDQSQK